MNCNGQAKARGFAHGFIESKVVGTRKLLETRVAEERFEADSAVPGKFSELSAVAGHDAAPQSEIGNRSRAERRRFPVEFAGIHGARRRVERHIEAERAAACGERPAARRGAFPFSAAGLVEVQMYIDQARQNRKARGIDLLLRCAQP